MQTQSQAIAEIVGAVTEGWLRKAPMHPEHSCRVVFPVLSGHASPPWITDALFAIRALPFVRDAVWHDDLGAVNIAPFQDTGFGGYVVDGRPYSEVGAA